MRRLIVNADDFGFTSGVNRAIAEAHSRGVVTSSTLMANGPAFDEAVQLAKSLPRLSIGCHVVLIDGRPILEAQQLPSFTNGTDFRVLTLPAAREVLSHEGIELISYLDFAPTPSRQLT